jgi:putative ABC transport system ATP-binding protein
VLHAEHIAKSYQTPRGPLTVLTDVSFSLAPGDAAAIMGPSGSGKSTLLGLLAGLDRPRSGRVWLDGVELGPLGEDERARLRAEKVGFVFQTFQLIPTLTALENVLVPLELRSAPAAPRAGEPERRDHRGNHAHGRARAMLARVGLGERMDHYPIQLSGGEQQRVGLARAFAAEPKVLFADEPTGSLDAETGRSVIDLLVELNRDAGTTLVLVTHDPALAARATRIIQLSGGTIVRGPGEGDT